MFFGFGPCAMNSKSVPRKNLRTVAGTSLLGRAVHRALRARQLLGGAGRVVVDTVRANGRLRRGGDALHVTLVTAVADGMSLPEDEILDVDAALQGLARLDERLVRVVEMRYFAGMTDVEIAGALGVTDRTVRRDWEKARLLLAHALKA